MILQIELVFHMKRKVFIMWNIPNSRTGWNLDREESHTAYFMLNGVTCYHDLSTDGYYAFLGIVRDRKVEFNTKEDLIKSLKR